MDGREQTVCLNMIVKNEAHVIRRCLASARPLIDAWVIADTGSTDGTQEIIREAMAGIPGVLLERPWVDFAHNRTEVLEAARGRCDYHLMIDADEEFTIDEGFVMPLLSADSYNIEVRYGEISYHRRQLVRSAWPGVMWVCSTNTSPATRRREATLSGVRTVVRHEGARSRDPLTYRRDALALERALLDEPDDSRYVFYLAQSYRDAGEPELAIRQYRRRAVMGGWRDEVWFSLYWIAQLEAQLGRPWPEVMASYMAAFQYLPERAEPLYRIAMHHQSKREFHAAKGFFEWARKIPAPGPTGLFVDRTIYDYLLDLEYAVCCFHTGDHHQAIGVNSGLLAEGKLPPHLIARVTENRQFSVNILAGGTVAAA